LDRFGHFSVASAKLALDDAGIDLAREDRERIGTTMGSALGGAAYAEGQFAIFVKEGIDRVDPMLALNVFVGSSSCNIAIELGLMGPNHTNGMSCASGTIGIGEGFRLIRDDYADAMVCGGVEAPLECDVIRVPPRWRILATMNVFDKNLLFEMSYALMRRFAFVEVSSPSDETFDRLLDGPGAIVKRLLPLRAYRDLGPAVYLDAARFAARRAADGPTESRLVYEIFYTFFLPQFEGMDDTRASALYRLMAAMLEPAEQAEAQRTIMEVLGVDVLP
jgi:hypothetical protein